MEQIVQFRTQDEVLKRFSQIAQEYVWYLIPGSEMIRGRREGKDHCPLTALHRSITARAQPYKMDQYYLAAGEMGMKQKLYEKFADAADNIGASILRRKLLKICGLVQK